MRKTILALATGAGLLFAGVAPAAAMPAGGGVNALNGAGHTGITDVGWRRCGWHGRWCRGGVGIRAPGVGVWIGGHPRRHWHHRGWYHHHRWHHHRRHW